MHFFKISPLKGLLLILLLSSFVARADSSEAKIPAGQREQPLQLLLINIGSETNPFWQAVGDATEAAAASLDIDLSVLYLADEDALDTTLDQLLGEDSAPDGIIFSGSSELSMKLLPRAEAAGIPTLLINSGLPDSAVEKASRRFSYWLGQITPPDSQVGYKVARALVQGVQNDGAAGDEAAKIIALTGGETDKAANERNEGLRHAVQQYPQAELLTLIETNWSAEDAAQKLSVALAEYPQANALWTVSGLMIPGILPAMSEAGRPAGDAMQLATLGWTQAGLRALSEGKVRADVGGHFLEGAWAVVVLHDHLQGRGLAHTLVMQSPVGVVSAGNMQVYKKAVEQGAWHQADFSSFSRRQGSECDSYRFSIESVLGLAE